MLTIDNKPIYTGYIKIENLAQFKTQVPLLHPDSPQYSRFWSKEFKRCIEGLWGEMFGGFRYMPGNLYYYGNYTLIQQTDKNKITHYLEAINSYGDIKKFIDPRENIRKIHKKPLGKPLYHNPTQNVGILGTRSGGKALIENTLIQVPDGQKCIQDINVGEYVYGKDGKTKKVIAKYQHDLVPTYNITFRSGRKITVSAGHLWEVKQWNASNLVIKDTASMYLDFSRPRGKNKKEYKYRICNNNTVEYTTKVFEIDPYLLGIILGDGGVYHYKYKTNHYKVMLTSGREDGLHYEKHFNLIGQKFNKYLKRDTNNWTYVFDKTLYDKFNNLGLVNHKADSKFIPKEYLYGDYNQRLQ